MIEEIYLPLWALHCFKHDLIFETSFDGSIEIIGCKSLHECCGCYPIGTRLLLDPRTLEEIEKFDTRDWLEFGKESYFMPIEYIEEKIKKYAESNEKFFYTRGISCDLDTIRIFKRR